MFSSGPLPMTSSRSDGSSANAIAQASSSTSIPCQAFRLPQKPATNAHAEAIERLRGWNAGLAPYLPLDGFYFSPLKVFEYMQLSRIVVSSNKGNRIAVMTSATLSPKERNGAVKSRNRTCRKSSRLLRQAYERV